MEKRKGIGRRFLTLALTLAMVLGLISLPPMHLSASAADTPASPVIVKGSDGKYDVTFNYQGEANTVGLRGTVPGANWDNDAIALTKGENNVWTVTLHDLESGSYEYKFVKNGNEWTHDPSNPFRSGDAADSNSVLYLKEDPVITNKGDNKFDVTFRYADVDNEANGKVNLMGDKLPGGSWDPGIPMKLSAEGSNIWIVTVAGFTPGTYEYKFTVNGNNWRPNIDGNLTFNINASYVSPEIKGTSVTFRYWDEKAKTVHVTGSMTGWKGANDGAIALNKGDDGMWSVTQTYAPGTYSYKFIVDGANDWIPDPANTGEKDSDGNSQFTVIDTSYISPEIDGTEVTFRYKDETAERVLLAGNMTNWEDGAKEMTKDDDGVWSITITLAPGNYEYKFIVYHGEQKDWKRDPLNDKVEGDNSAFTVTGLAPATGLTVKTGDSLELPEKLNLYTDDGSSSEVEVTYTLNGSPEGVTLKDRTLSVPKGFTGDTVTLTATADDNTAEITVTVVSTQYTYTIYFFDWDESHMDVNAADIHAWEIGGSDLTPIPFTEKVNLSGRDWLKATLVTHITKLGLIPRSKGTWDWQTTNHEIDNTEKKDLTIYIVMGDQETYFELPTLPDEQGREFFVPGTFPGPSWDAGSNKMSVYDEENKLYAYTFKSVPAANYEFKIAVNGTWTENYGVGGVQDGSNYGVTVPETMDVTVYYSDVSHLAVTNLNYEFVDVTLAGTSIPEDTRLVDSGLTGIYSATVKLPAGTYADIYLQGKDGKIGDFTAFTLAEEREVTFYYAPVYGVWYCDAFPWDDAAQVSYNTKLTEYKSIYGAIPTDTPVTFTVKAGEAVTGVSMIISGRKEPIEMTKSGRPVGGLQKWSAKVTMDTIGEYDYFFVVSQAGGIKVYCDDDGYYGEGHLTELTQVQPYDLVVYKAGYKTPDWMKNAVIYQIFPDRFFDGDETNNKAQLTARGPVNYEFPAWNVIPENPEQEELLNEEEYKATGAFFGDGEWSNEMYGGDLAGITQKVEYLKSLGVTVIYLNPVFSSISSHRYDTSDYEKIDPILGDLEDFKALVKAADDNGMHIVLDGVFNHVSDDSKYFDRYYKFLETGLDTVGAYPYWAYVYDYMAEHDGATQADAEKAAKDNFTTKYGITDFSYTEWFEVFNEPLTAQNESGTASTTAVDSIGLRAGKPVYRYDGWWGYDSMPIIKSTEGSEYQTGTWAEEIIDGEDSVSRYWLEQGSDGWRLDVANEVSDETWQMFREAVKETGADNVIIGEIWDDATKYLMGDMYDSVMNYMFRNAVVGFAKGGSSQQATKDMERLRERYPQEAFYAMMNLVDSHDTTRIVSYLDGIDDDRNQKDVEFAFPTYEGTSQLAKDRQKLVAFLQYTYAGAPTVYYGDERGMAGADDPDDRRTIDWETADKALLDWYTKLGGLRGEHSALRTGSVEPIEDTTGKILGFVRRDSKETLVVLANNDQAETTVTLTLDELNINTKSLTDLISDTEYTVEGGKVTVTVPALSGVILKARKTSAPSGGPGGSTPGNPSTPSTPAPDVTTGKDNGTTETVATPETSGGSVTVPADMGDEIVKQVKDNNSDTAVVAPEFPSGTTKADVTVPAKTVRELGDTDADLRIETPAADVTIPNAALAGLAEAGNVTVSTDKSGEAVAVSVTAGGKAVDTTVKAALALSGGDVAYMVNADGTETIIPKSVVENGVTYVLIDGSATIKVVENSKTFTDVKSTDWFAGYVDFVTSHTIFDGTGETTFAPRDTMNRAMLATVIWKLEGRAAAENGKTFTDVAAGTWYSDGIAWASANGVIQGSDGKFDPDRAVTRQEMAVMIYNYAKGLGLDMSKTAGIDGFADASEVSTWAKDAMSWTYANGIITGTGSGLNPAGTASRSEVAAVLQRLVSLIVK